MRLSLIECVARQRRFDATLEENTTLREAIRMRARVRVRRGIAVGLEASDIAMEEKCAWCAFHAIHIASLPPYRHARRFLILSLPPCSVLHSLHVTALDALFPLTAVFGAG